MNLMKTFIDKLIHIRKRVNRININKIDVGLTKTSYILRKDQIYNRQYPV